MQKKHVLKQDIFSLLYDLKFKRLYRILPSMGVRDGPHPVVFRNTLICAQIEPGSQAYVTAQTPAYKESVIPSLLSFRHHESILERLLVGA